MPIILKELAVLCNAQIEGGDPNAIIHSAADITSAENGQVTQLTSAKYTHYIKNTAASACFIAVGRPVDDVPKKNRITALRRPRIKLY